MRPHAALKPLAQAKQHIRHRAPTPSEAELKESPGNSWGIVPHVRHIHHQREHFHFGVRDVRLQEDVHLSVRACRSATHVHVAGLPPQPLEFQHLVLPGLDVFELRTEGDHLQELRH